MKLIIKNTKPRRFVTDSDVGEKFAVTPVHGLSVEGHTTAILANLIERDHGPLVAMKFRINVAVDDHIETVAEERDYSSAVSLASYTSSTKSDWAAEAQAFVKWRDDVWEYVFTRLAAVESGEEEPPESAEAFIQNLPVMVWPE